MIQLFNASLAFGGQVILNDVSWSIRDNLRIGLVGPNGAGKTTLLRLLSGKMQLDGGTLDIPGGTSLGYLEQDTQEATSGRTVLEEALQAFAHILHLMAEEERLTAAMDAQTDHASPEWDKLLRDFDRVHTELLACDAHTLRPRTEAVLMGLGFSPDDLHRPLATFSGGWRMRVALARLLLQRPDVLLLDEPTNHLDIDSIGWLETYLKTYPGTVVLVSHDRYFLDRMTTHTAELVQGRLTEYTGNYSTYLEARTERRALQQAAFDNQQKAIADTERFIERFRAKATKARQVQSRVKSLDKLDRVEAPPEESASVHFRFPEPERSGKVVLELSKFSKIYPTDEGEIEVFRDAEPILLERGSKVALIGKNGAGKSTLARILRGSEPFEGTRTLGYNVSLTFFAQHQAETLDPKDTILDSLRAVSRGQSETQLRGLLGAFLFRGDDVFKPIGVLSGGERSRVALARTLLTPANFLILDEPTNHLDMASIAVLVEALRQYSGTFVVVSHDRHFLDQVATHIWRVEDGAVRQYEGNYTEYLWQIEHGTGARIALKKEEPAAQTQPSRSGPKTKEQKRLEAEARKQKGPVTPSAKGTSAPTSNPAQLKKQYEALEATLFQKEAEKERLEQQLSDPTLYEDAARWKATHDAYAAVQAELPTLYTEWERLAEQLSAQPSK